MVSTIDRETRRELRRTLQDHYGFLGDVRFGPQAVEAGECDRCGEAPRIVPLCGPVSYRAVCAGCVDRVGEDGWCDGHRDDATDAAAFTAALPDEWATVVRLWWIGTGEVRLDPALLALPVLPTAVRAALPEVGRTDPDG